MYITKYFDWFSLNFTEFNDVTTTDHVISPVSASTTVTPLGGLAALALFGVPLE